MEPSVAIVATMLLSLNHPRFFPNFHILPEMHLKTILFHLYDPPPTPTEHTFANPNSYPSDHWSVTNQ